MKKFKIHSDNELNPQLKEKVQSMRGLIFSNAPKILNPRFKMASCYDRPCVIIMDIESGKITKPIALCHMHGAIQVLNDLFGS